MEIQLPEYSISFSIKEILLLSEVAKTNAEAKRLIQQGVTIWIDKFDNIPLFENSCIHSLDGFQSRLKKVKSDEIVVESGDTLLIGRDTYRAKRLNFYDKELQSFEDLLYCLKLKAYYLHNIRVNYIHNSNWIDDISDRYFKKVEPFTKDNFYPALPTSDEIISGKRRVLEF